MNIDPIFACQKQRKTKETWKNTKARKLFLALFIINDFHHFGVQNLFVIIMNANRIASIEIAPSYKDGSVNNDQYDFESNQRKIQVFQQTQQTQNATTQLSSTATIIQFQFPQRNPVLVIKSQAQNVLPSCIRLLFAIEQFCVFLSIRNVSKPGRDFENDTTSLIAITARKSTPIGADNSRLMIH